MTVHKTYREWLDSTHIDENTKQELRDLAGDEREIEDRFYTQLTFGTGGMRGVMGAGTNRINTYTIRRATQGLANTIAKLGAEAMSKGVVIAHDSRHLSPELALETALTLAANGIRVYLFDALRPTPELSFAVRELGAQAGVVLTASHNPPAYNGYKVYWADGAQIATERADEVTAAILQVRGFEDVRTMAREEAEAAGLLIWIGEAIDERYQAALQGLLLHPELAASSDLRIVYTPLHGAGVEAVPRALRTAGFAHVHVVAEQAVLDSNFTTVRSPNPEEREAFTLGLQLGATVGADLVIATDPDADRVGVMARGQDGTYVQLTGNQTGALLMHYILSSHEARGTMPSGATVIKTVVTSELGREIADRFGVDTIDVLTGFKYIGEQIRLFEETGDRNFLFGYEESYGYLAGTFVREKDAVMTALLIADMAAWYKQQGLTLVDALDGLFREFGYYQEELVSHTLCGLEGIRTIQRIMDTWRSEAPLTIGEMEIVELRDYLKGTWTSRLMDDVMLLDLPKENVLHYTLADGSWFCLRPSGTEPKIKLYFSVRGTSQEDAQAKAAQLVQQVMARIDFAEDTTETPVLH